MAVYKRSYRGYAGPLTAAWSRFAIIPRYACRDLFQSKFLTAFFVACFVPPLVFLFLIYLRHNLHFLSLLQESGERLIAINGPFFLRYLGIQGVLAFILTAFLGPTLISADLANQALPLYLSRPFSRAEYVLGKMSVLMILLSLITWVPGLALFAVQSALEGWTWFTANLWMARAILLGAWIWILVISLLALALSAWIKWKLAARALLLAVFFIGAGFGQAINEVLRVRWGTLLDLAQLMGAVGCGLFRIRSEIGIAPQDACNMLLAICAACLALLARKVRAIEVVR